MLEPGRILERNPQKAPEEQACGSPELWRNFSVGLYANLKSLLLRELSSKPELPARLRSEMQSESVEDLQQSETAKRNGAETKEGNGSILKTFRQAVAYTWRQGKGLFLLGTGISLAMAAVPLATSWLNGVVVNSLNAGFGPLSAAIAGVFLVYQGQSLLQRFGGILSWHQNLWRYRQNQKNASETVASWSPEQLEDSGQRDALYRFYQQSDKIFNFFDCGIQSFSSIFTAATAALLVSQLDWRLSLCSLCFVGLRLASDYRTAKYNFQVEKGLSAATRTNSGLLALVSEPRAVRDISQLGKTDGLRREYLKRADNLNDIRMLAQRRTQRARFGLDVLSSGIVAASVAALFARWSSGAFNMGDIFRLWGFVAAMQDACRGVSYSLGQMLEAHPFVHDCLAFLATCSNGTDEKHDANTSGYANHAPQPSACKIRERG